MWMDQDMKVIGSKGIHMVLVFLPSQMVPSMKAIGRRGVSWKRTLSNIKWS